MSCSNVADDVWEQTQINIGKETLETQRGQTNQMEINTSGHCELFYRGSV
jgi:hypothetical protein